MMPPLQALDYYTIVTVRPNGSLMIATWEWTGTLGTRYHEVRSRWKFPNWADALTRKKPWSQPGPVIVVKGAW
jgi:hypothetical protein